MGHVPVARKDERGIFDLPPEVFARAPGLGPKVFATAGGLHAREPRDFTEPQLGESRLPGPVRRVRPQPDHRDSGGAVHLHEAPGDRTVHALAANVRKRPGHREPAAPVDAGAMDGHAHDPPGGVGGDVDDAVPELPFEVLDHVVVGAHGGAAQFLERSPIRGRRATNGPGHAATPEWTSKPAMCESSRSRRPVNLNRGRERWRWIRTSPPNLKWSLSFGGSWTT